MGICCMAQETQTGALYQSRGVGWGWKWEGGSKGREYIYTYGWSCRGLTENNKMLQSNYPSIKNKFKKKKRKKNNRGGIL